MREPTELYICCRLEIHASFHENPGVISCEKILEEKKMCIRKLPFIIQEGDQIFQYASCFTYHNTADLKISLRTTLNTAWLYVLLKIFFMVKKNLEHQLVGNCPNTNKKV